MPKPSAPTLLGGILASALHAALILAVAFGGLGYPTASRAAETSSEPREAPKEASGEELQKLVGPIALYPDELLAIVLPASTYPLQIVQAARLLEKRKTEPDLQPEEDWDPSVIGLMNYPEVIDLMNEDLDWTWKLGEAVADQQADVMDAVQRFRAKADEAGNLESNDKVTVTQETEENQQIIVIESASPEVIYVPSYEPTTVIVYQTSPYPYYYSRPYPYYYRPAAAFWTGMFVGAAVGWGMRWGWRGSSIDINRNVNVNVNRPTRPSTPNRPDRPGSGPGDRPGSGGREQWKADKGRGKQSGGRPGGAATRPAQGSARPGMDRPAAGQGTRPSAAAGSKARPTQSASGRSGSGKRSSGRDLTSGSRSARSSKGSSLGSYSNGSRSRAHGSRGASSRGGHRGGGGRRR